MAELRLSRPLALERRAALTAVLDGATERSPRAVVDELQQRADSNAMVVLGLLAQQGALLEAEQAHVPAGRREAVAQKRLNALVVKGDTAQHAAALSEYLRLAECGVSAYLRERGT